MGGTLRSLASLFLTDSKVSRLWCASQRNLMPPEPMSYAQGEKRDLEAVNKSSHCAYSFTYRDLICVLWFILRITFLFSYCFFPKAFGPFHAPLSTSMEGPSWRSVLIRTSFQAWNWQFTQGLACWWPCLVDGACSVWSGKRWQEHTTAIHEDQRLLEQFSWPQTATYVFLPCRYMEWIEACARHSLYNSAVLCVGTQKYYCMWAYKWQVIVLIYSYVFRVAWSCLVVAILGLSGQQTFTHMHRL